MSFNIYEQASGTQKKRLLKSQSKSLKFTSTSFNLDTKAKSQGSDYMIGVYEPGKDKCYLIPVSAAYQIQQKIDGFQERFSASGNQGATKTYYEQKQVLAQSFGTAKAQRKLQSVMTNRVEDGEPNPKNTKGVRDARVHDMAASVAKDTNEAKKAAANTQNKKSTTYGRAALMPAQILELLPYKETHEALKNSDYDALHQLLNRFV